MNARLNSEHNLCCVRSEVGGWPPLVITFQHYYDKEAILNRADMLERSGILVKFTADVSLS